MVLVGREPRHNERYVGALRIATYAARVTSWFCDCWTVLTNVPLEDLEPALDAAAVSVDADRRIRSAGTDSASLPEVRFVFELDADGEDQAAVRAAAVVTAAVAGSHLERAHWTYRVRNVG